MAVTRPRRRGRPEPRRGGADVPGLPAREAALKLIRAALDDGAPADERQVSAPPEVAASARGLADTTFRRLGQIDDVLGRFVDRTPKGAGQHILRLMAAELLFAGTPPHAAVDLAVRLARNSKSSGIAGLVNAVGRKIAAEGAEIVVAQDPVRLNASGWLAKRLRQDWGQETAAAIARAHLTPAPHDLTLASPADAEVLARELDAVPLPTGSLRLRQRPQISALPGYAEGAWWVQDAAAALPARLLGDVVGQRVLDLCAAPGGKTLQLAAAGASVTALDISDNRMRRVTDNLSRTGLSAETVVADALDWTPPQSFDAILLDAPCSATGTVRRHPELPHRLRPNGLDALIEVQANLLDRAWQWLAPGGLLVFATCSLLKAEGEGQAKAFLDRTPDAEVAAISGADEDLPEEFVAPGGFLRTRPDIWPALWQDLWPAPGGLDGFFVARFRRSA